ncbi:serrate RNA effector molecule homolog [Diaphorina citri]|uniref:Serrate RNA effector molecule homolog n=1 Tax=Diaphorina citri TaxID=121845 RepID=A0A3Q0IMG8_DIACI|nr:serrate RNA effector molecule homolog [Diaphorina citri]
MADSDDEYDRKRRDKFRGERTESYTRGEGRREERRPRDDWSEREGWNSRSRGRGDYRGAPRERYSPPRHEMSPPVKRMRPDWDEARPLPYERPVYPSAYNPGWPSHEPSYAPAAPRGVAPSSSAESLETQPPMLSLKAFMQTQDDNVGVDEALKKYNEYKLEFRRQQLNEFFVAHKDEEW